MLGQKGVRSIKFLQKYLYSCDLRKDERYFEVLDLSANHLNKRLHELKELVTQPYFKFETLIISDNHLTAKQLNELCQSLLQCDNLIHLDIRNNAFVDTDLKIMYPFLQKNKNLRKIEYSLSDPVNIKKKKYFESLSSLPTHSVRTKLST